MLGPCDAVAIFSITERKMPRYSLCKEIHTHTHTHRKPSLLWNGYQVFLDGNVQPEHAAYHWNPSSAMVMEEYTTAHPLGHTGTVMGTVYLFFINTEKAKRNILYMKH